MSILFINPSADLYGADRSFVRTIRAIQEKYDDELHAVLPYNGPLVDRLRDLGVQVHVFKLAVMRRKYFNVFGIFVWGFAIIYALLRLVWLCKRHNIRLIHSNASSVFVGGAVGKMLGIPHLWHLREIIVSPAVVRKFVTWTYQQFATKVIGVSNPTIDHLVASKQGLKSKSVVVHNGIDLEDYDLGTESDLKGQLAIQDETILVGMIGRVSHWKGQDLFMEVAERLKDSNIHFLALGSPFKGQEWRMEEFQRQVSQKNLSKNFTIRSFDADVSRYLNAFDVFVLPSTLPDPFPTTVLEAMAYGKAIVANGHGGVTDMIADGQEGFLVTPNDAEAMAARIRELAMNEALRTELGEAAQAKLKKHFSYKVYEENIVSVFDLYLS